MGNDGDYFERIAGTNLFQSTFPRGERPVKFLVTNDYSNFNPRSRVGNDKCVQTFVSLYIDFNPRSRVGNDRVSKMALPQTIISIHVPAWGTTVSDGVTVTYPSDFNPRSRVGNDVSELDTFFTPKIFQSTFPRGERPHLRVESVKP